MHVVDRRGRALKEGSRVAERDGNDDATGTVKEFAWYSGLGWMVEVDWGGGSCIPERPEPHLIADTYRCPDLELIDPEEEN